MASHTWGNNSFLCWLRWQYTVVTFFIDSNLVYYYVIYPYTNISAIFWSVVIGGYNLITQFCVSLISVPHQKDSLFVLQKHSTITKIKKPNNTKHYGFSWYCNIHVSKYCLSNYYLGVVSYMTSLCIAVAWSTPSLLPVLCTNTVPLVVGALECPPSVLISACLKPSGPSKTDQSVCS